MTHHNFAAGNLLNACKRTIFDALTAINLRYQRYDIFRCPTWTEIVDLTAHTCTS